MRTDFEDEDEDEEEHDQLYRFVERTLQNGVEDEVRPRFDLLLVDAAGALRPLGALVATPGVTHPDAVVDWIFQNVEEHLKLGDRKIRIRIQDAATNERIGSFQKTFHHEDVET
jgi:hypothetical protein